MAQPVKFLILITLMSTAIYVYIYHEFFDAATQQREFYRSLTFLESKKFNRVHSDTVKGNLTSVNVSAKPLPHGFLPLSKIRERVSKWLSLSDIIQIYKETIDPKLFDFEKDVKKIRIANKTEGVPEQNSCAVVGNSGILMGSKCGRGIDAHDYVMRMNLAPFGQNLGRDVGQTANVTTMNYFQMVTLGRYARGKFRRSKSGAANLEYLKLYNHSVIWYPKGGAKEGNMNDLARGMKETFNFDVRWAYSPKSLFGKVPRIWRQRVPSTGLIVLSAASLFCRRITLFGFYPFYTDRNNRTLLYHYYGKQKMNYTTNPHSMPQEFKLFLQLEKKGALRIQQDVCEQ